MLRATWRAWLVGVFCFAMTVGTAAHALAAQAPAEASADALKGDDSKPGVKVDVSVDAKTLVEQLGDVDFKVRESATNKLKEMGTAALPALKEAIASAADPEVCSRADSLVRQIERPRIPSDWLGPQAFRGGVQVTTSRINGVSRVEVDDGSGLRKISISEGPAGIDMTISGTENGQPVNARFRARGPGELEEQDPQAFQIYQRWAGNAGAAFMRGRRLVAPQFRAQPLRLAGPVPVPPADDLTVLEERVLKQLRQAKVPDDKQRSVKDLLRELQQLQAEGQAVAPVDWNKQIQKYNALSDALREKLAALKLPDPGDTLPPPAKSRLGISVGAVDPGLLGPGGDLGLTVHRVVPDSRAERLGLKEGDVIRKVNGKPVADTGALRRTVTEAKEPLAIEIVRDGKPQTLREKPEP